MSSSTKYDIVNRANDIKTYISHGDIENSVKSSIDFTRDFSQDFANQALLISNRFWLLKEDIRKGIISHENSSVEKNRIANDIVEMISTIVNNNVKLITEELQEVHHKEIKFSDYAVKTIKLRKRYRSSGFVFTCSKLEIRQGETVGVVGENAAGKTTLLRLLGGELNRTDGNLCFPSLGGNGNLNWLNLKRAISYVPQKLPKWRGSLRNNLSYEAASVGLNQKQIKIETEFIIQRLGLVNFINHRWEELSSGYKLRFALARALIKTPSLLILDEPLANLDFKSQNVLRNDLRAFAGRIKNPPAIVLSSQHIQELESFVDRILFLRAGMVEDLDAYDIGNRRIQNIFEFSCHLSKEELIDELSELRYNKIYNPSNLQYVITTPLTVDLNEFLKFLISKGIRLRSFNDISKSVKAKFYGEN